MTHRASMMPPPKQAVETGRAISVSLMQGLSVEEVGARR